MKGQIYQTRISYLLCSILKNNMPRTSFVDLIQIKDKTADGLGKNFARIYIRTL